MGKLIDLHLHLDGAITADIAGKLAALQGIELPDGTALERLLTVPEDCRDLNAFLERFALPCSLLQTGAGIREAVFLVAEHIRAQGIIYAEIRFAPQKCTDRGLAQEEAILAALEGLRRTRLKANLILCCMRGAGNEAENRETVALAARYLVEDGGVVAVDLAGAEALYPTRDYAALFTEVRRLHIPFTLHAGEAAGPESVRQAIAFGARRIGHGVRSLEDPAVVAMLREKGIFLEMCPTSNRQTRAIPNMAEYPLVDFLRAGLRVTLNTDDMAIEGTTLAREFRYMEECFGLTEAQEEQLLMNAVDAAFTTPAVKALLRKQIADQRTCP